MFGQKFDVLLVLVSFIIADKRPMGIFKQKLLNNKKIIARAHEESYLTKSQTFFSPAIQNEAIWIELFNEIGIDYFITFIHIFRLCNHPMSIYSNDCIR